MFWFDKSNANTIFIDNRYLFTTLCDGRKLEINPDYFADFRDLPFDDNTFYLAVFDPPHLINAGDKSWLALKYGKLQNTWQNDIKLGFDEAMRVLKPWGTLIFKWNEEQIKLKEILKCTPYKPLFGDKRNKTHWLVFMKEADNEA
jgi:hypothetical protein